MKNIFMTEQADKIGYVYSDEIKSKLCCPEKIFNKADVLANPELFKETEYIFSTWGMSTFSADEIKSFFPNLKAIFYAAGTVQYFARPFLQNNVKIFSAWAANAVPVAEYTLSQILLANKGFFHLSALRSGGDTEISEKLKNKFPGNYDVTVGIIGAGMIGKKVINLLKPFKIKTVVFDPFLSDNNAKKLGTEKVGLKKLFSVCEIVSNHLANNEQTKGMLNYSLFSQMKPYSTFINTGRGAQVVEDDLIKALTERPDIYAVLDVTYPEPPCAGSRLYSLPNCILTPHIAGSIGNEVHRMAQYMLNEYENFISGGSCLYEVSEKMLETMA
jgi:phosphoglycerate dehydrogenase-like enzyme